MKWLRNQHSLGSLSLALVVATLLSAKVLLSIVVHASGNWDYTGTGTVAVLITNTCADVDGACQGQCVYETRTFQKCAAGSSDCVPGAILQTSPPYSGTCYRTGNFMVNAIFDVLKNKCKLQIGAKCGGNCECKVNNG